MLNTPDRKSAPVEIATGNGNPPDLSDLDAIDVPDRPNWENGPPHELFKELRGRCPVHWSEIPEDPEGDAFCAATKAKDVREVGLDWQTYSSERGGVTGLPRANPHELARTMCSAPD